MKIIPKKQSGGSFTSYFTTYTPVAILLPELVVLKSTESSNDTKGQLTEKDFFDMIKDIDGLPNEMNDVIGNLISTFQMSNLTGINTGNLATLYLLSLTLLRLMAQNKLAYDDAVANASKNGAMAEPAISMDGKLLILNDDGSIGTLSIEAFNSNRDLYLDKILTVSNLANMRKYDPSLAYSLGIFDIINNSVGFESFQGLLDLAIKSLGSSEISRSGLINTEAALGLALLLSLRKDDRILALSEITSKGLYEYKIIDKNLLSQLNALKLYLLAVLPDRAKTWAALKTGNTNKNQATERLIYAYLFGLTSDVHSFKGSIESANTSSSNSSTEDLILDDVKLNTAAKWAIGAGVLENMVLNPLSNEAISVLATTMPLTDKEGKYLGANSTLQDMTTGEYSPILDLRNATMGMHKIDPIDFKKVVLMDGKISAIDFPAIKKDGNIVPNLSPEVFDAKFKADREIKQLGIDLSNPESIALNYKVINDIYTKYGLDPAYKADGTPSNNWARFGVINAYASNLTLGIDPMDTNGLLKSIEDDDIISSLEKITEEDIDTRDWWNPLDWGSTWYDEMYLGTVWIPVLSSKIAALANVDLKVNQINTIIDKEAEANALQMVTKEKQ